MSGPLVDTPLLFALCDEMGFFAVLDRYFDENMCVLENAPQQLKDEVALLRSDIQPPTSGE